MPHCDIPSAEQIALALRADRKILPRRCTANMIRQCLVAFDRRRSLFKKALKQFEQRLRDSPDEVKVCIHSIRTRTKELWHLVDKIRRKALGRGQHRLITPKNLFDHDAQNPDKAGITDLGGVRILHRYKQEWKPIHGYLTTKMTRPFELVEKIAYIRPEESRADYRSRKSEDGFMAKEIKSRQTNYTSLHYVFQYCCSGMRLPLFIECQVRTLFEEGWAEINHLRQYPYEASELEKAQLSNLNDAANLANRVAGMFREIDQLPIFIPWEMELMYERSASDVYVFSPSLDWPSAHVSALKKHLRQAHGTFHYFHPSKKDLDAMDQAAARTVRSRATRLRRTMSKVYRRFSLKAAAHTAGNSPIFSDILLLKGSVRFAGPDVRAPEIKDLGVVGTPTTERRAPPGSQRLDMLIRSDAHVERLKTFFREVCGCNRL